MKFNQAALEASRTTRALTEAAKHAAGVTWVGTKMRNTVQSKESRPVQAGLTESLFYGMAPATVSGYRLARPLLRLTAGKAPNLHPM